MKLSIRTSLAGALALLLSACGGGGTTPPAVPTITTQPAGATVALGATATFTVVATGSPTYQWKRNGTPIAGATSASYATPATAKTDDGASFTVELSNAGGTIASSSAVLGVAWVEISAQSGDLAVSAGDAATLEVTAAGTGTLGYHWTKGGVAATGVTGPALQLAPATADDAATYGCRVSATLNGVTVSADAAPMVLAVGAGPLLSASATTITAGEGVILTYTFGGAATLQAGAGAPAAVTSGAWTAVYPEADTTYTLVANDGTEVTRTVNVAVKAYTPRFLYVANNGSDDVSVYPVIGNATDGYAIDVASSTRPAAGDGPIAVVGSPDGAFVYVVNHDGSSVSAYAVSASDGALTPAAGSPFAIAGDTHPWGAAVDPAGHHLYVACENGVRGFAIDPDTGALTGAARLGADLAARGAGDVLVHPSGRFLHVVDSGGGKIAAFRIDPATGALTLVDSFPAPGASALVLDRAGTTLFARGEPEVAENHAALAVFAVDPYTGALTQKSLFEGLEDMGQDYPKRPLVRGTEGRHGLAFSRKPGLDRLLEAYAGEVDSMSYFSEYLVDLSAGTLTGDYRDPSGNTWSSPFFINDFVIFDSPGDAIVVDRSGSLVVLPIPYSYDRLYWCTTDADGNLWPAMDSFSQLYQPTGSTPAHAAFVGTLAP